MMPQQCQAQCEITVREMARSVVRSSIAAPNRMTEMRQLQRTASYVVLLNCHTRGSVGNAVSHEARAVGAHHAACRLE